MGFQVAKYPSPGDYEQHLDRLAARCPGQFAHHADRRTWSGDHDLRWLTVGDPSRPAFLMVSVLHAMNEWQGAHVTMRFVEKLLDPDDNQRQFSEALLSQYCLVAVPMANAWGYFAAPLGEHSNGHASRVPDIAAADWHDMTHYSHYYGVNLNRNFDFNWDAYPNLPFSVRSYWNGTDYGNANYFMMPFYVDDEGREVYDPENTHPNHILKPDPAVYDCKGTAPFSEPETQLIRDLFDRYDVIGFMDWHVMNTWQTNGASYVSQTEDRDAMVQLVDDGVERVNRRHPSLATPMPRTRHIVMEEYDHGAPYAINWAQNRMGVTSFDWETGTGFPDEVWTDAYLEIFYRALHWMQP